MLQQVLNWVDFSKRRNDAKKIFGIVWTFRRIHPLTLFVPTNTSDSNWILLKDPSSTDQKFFILDGTLPEFIKGTLKSRA